MEARTAKKGQCHQRGPAFIVNSGQTTKVIAAFDFDKTLTIKHTFWRLLLRAVGPWRFGYGVVRLTPAILKFLLGRMKLLELRERTIQHFLAGFPTDRFSVLCEEFARNELPRWIRPDAAERLAWHRERGDHTVIVSNAPEDYLVPWAASVGVPTVLGSRFEVDRDRLTGRLVGDHCYGHEKVRRLREQFGDLSQYEIYAYGDSSGDMPMLNAATHGYYRTFSTATTGSAAHGLPGKPTATV